jgi:hypothetical protein
MILADFDDRFKEQKHQKRFENWSSGVLEHLVWETEEGKVQQNRESKTEAKAEKAEPKAEPKADAAEPKPVNVDTEEAGEGKEGKDGEAEGILKTS